MKMYVVGIGPGNPDEITPRAQNAIKHADIVVGYDLYIEQLKPIFPDKSFVASHMKQEVERCRAAVEQALSGLTVAMVSSGDAGIYGMAALLHEAAAPYAEIEIEVIPGITAACSASAVLGAPLTHDFAVISLSDLLTPWEKIETRLKYAAMAGFVICLYNPSSKKRADYLSKACAIVGEYLPCDTPCGFVRNIGRDGQESRVLTLAQLAATPADMFTTVIIGSPSTKVVGGRLVTPRGYAGI